MTDDATGRQGATNGRRRRGVPRWSAVLLAMVVATLLAGAVLVPRDFLPRPTGPYPIGTTVFTVSDAAREDIFAPGRPRTLTVQAWYPAAPGSSGPVEPYLRDRDALAGLLDYAGAPRWLLWYLASSPTHALTDAPPAEGRFPVVVVLTGNMGYRQSQTIQVEELVSRGFVVVGLDQPGTASSALLEDGRRIPYAGWTVAKPLIDQSIDPVSPAPTLRGTP
ncbi:alpha/beta hydrolase [Nigerium massiliense]|uniref:hypothetical protein n=1 Tax=Nigerium massiliense TaxID=1522317 RepID=UPI000693983E|nr:hypothetical protein [Nigerium massiliense]